MWLIIFPEGTRSRDGKVQEFKRGVSIFSERTKTPLLFTFLEGNAELWPKGRIFAVPGKLVLHVGPVHPPGPIEEVYADYKKWVLTINPNAFPAVITESTEPSTEPKKEETNNDSEQI